jgi:hypothetical protein
VVVIGLKDDTHYHHNSSDNNSSDHNSSDNNSSDNNSGEKKKEKLCVGRKGGPKSGSVPRGPSGRCHMIGPKHDRKHQMESDLILT